MKKSITLKRILLLAILGLFALSSYGQSRPKMRKAGKVHDRFSFIDAREIYLQVIDLGYSSPQLYQNLADTYYFNGQYADAAEYYDQLLELFPNEEYPDPLAPEYYFRAAQSKKSLGKFDKADELMMQYADNGGDSLIISNYMKSKNYLENIAANAKSFNLNPVGVNTEGSDFVSSFYNDQLLFASTTNGTGVEVYEWTKDGFLDLYIADIGENGELTNPRPLPGEVNSPFHESSTALSSDGKTLYFTRNNVVEGKKKYGKDKLLTLKLFRAQMREDGSWGDVERLQLEGDTDTTSFAHPTLSLDGNKLYFASDRKGGFGASDIWYVELNSDGSFGSSVNLGPDINTGTRESFPFISKENILYFSSDGHPGLGGIDVFSTTLDSAGMPTKIENMGEPVNSGLDDFGFIIDSERRLAYVSSNRSGSEGSLSDDIYTLQFCEVTIAGSVANRDTGEYIEGAVVTLLDENSQVVATAITDVSGRYQFDKVLGCDETYLVRATMEGCEPQERLVQTPKESQQMEVPVLLPCDPCPADDLGCRLSLQPIYFDFDKDNIRPDAEIELAKILSALNEYPQLIIHIESHTDSRGDDLYNEDLSERRAQSTMKWLIAKGIDPGRLSAKGYGEYQLTNRCGNGSDCTEEEHQLNRRSMFIIQN